MNEIVVAAASYADIEVTDDLKVNVLKVGNGYEVKFTYPKTEIYRDIKVILKENEVKVIDYTLDKEVRTVHSKYRIITIDNEKVLACETVRKLPEGMFEDNYTIKVNNNFKLIDGIPKEKRK